MSNTVRIIKSFSALSEKAKTLDEFHKLALKEDLSDSELIVKAIEEYLKAHPQNPAYSLDAWKDAPEVKAYPTPWKRLGRSDLKGYSNGDLEEMRARLRQNADTLEGIIRYPVATRSTGARR